MFREEGKVWSQNLFLIIDTPFPIADRWTVLKLTADESRARRHEYDQCWTLLVGNVNAAEGCFHIKPGPETDTTDLVREEISDVGGHVPGWVMRMGAKVIVPQIYRNLEKRMGQDHRP